MTGGSPFTTMRADVCVPLKDGGRPTLCESAILVFALGSLEIRRTAHGRSAAPPGLVGFSIPFPRPNPAWANSYRASGAALSILCSERKNQNRALGKG